MLHSEEALKNLEGDPARVRAYFWNVAVRAKLLASRTRAEARRGVSLSPGGLTPETLEAFSAAILEHLEGLSAASLKHIERLQVLVDRAKLK